MQIHINCNEQLQVFSSQVLKAGQEGNLCKMVLIFCYFLSNSADRESAGSLWSMIWLGKN